MNQTNHHHRVSGKRLGLAILLNITITIAEALGGIIAGSMSLLSDAAHNLSDVVSLSISYLANRLAGQKSTVRRTFGLKRAEILAALINSAVLMVLALIILIEGVKRLYIPVPINPSWVIWLSLLSIAVNGASILFIKSDVHNSINVKSAYLHLFSDMLTSIAVLAGGIAIKYLNWNWVDAVFSILIAIYLLYTSWGILKTSLKIFMQFSPDSIDINLIVQKIQTLAGIKNIHHVHVWQIDEHEIMFEAHVDLTDNFRISDFEIMQKRIESILTECGINHITIQPEFSVTDNKQLLH